jgi:hypothetical protein
MSELKGTGIFEDVTSNHGIITMGNFNDQSTNIGVVLSTATFSHSSVNTGFVNGHALFFNESENSSNSVAAPVVFTGNSVNTGSLNNAIFLDYSINAGTVATSAIFANSSSNTGYVQGEALFLPNTTNSGSVQNAKIAGNITNTGTIATSALYVVAGNYFPDAYYDIYGQKASPSNWPIVVKYIGGFWFKYNSLGVASLANGIYNDGAKLYTFVNGVKQEDQETPIIRPFLRLDYATTDNVLVKGSSVLWNGQYAGATVAASISGRADVDQDGNLDYYFTTNTGVLSWDPIVYYPYIHVGYYSTDETLINGTSVLWSSYYSGATTVKNISGFAEFNLDNNFEIFQTNNAGIITWFTASAHPFSHFGYYADVPILTKGATILWDGFGTGAFRVRNSSGQADVDKDGNADQWFTSSTGFLNWYMISAHPYLNLGYYTDTIELSSGSTVLYYGQGTGAAVVSNVSGMSVDLNADGNLDTWVTDSNGVISWGSTFYYPYTFGIYYSNSPTLTSGTSVFYTTPYSSATTVNNLTGILDLTQDGNDDLWSTNGSGVVTFATITAHPFSHLGYYSDDAVLINNQSILWNGFGTGAVVASGLDGIFDIDNDLTVDYWSTNNAGVISWVSSIQYPYSYLSYYTNDLILQNGITVLYNTALVGATVVANVTGIADIGLDGNDDQWSTDNSGVVSWYMISAHPYSNLGYFTNTIKLTSGSSKLYLDKGTGASVVANISGVYDFELDGNDDQWSTDNSGVVSWYMISAHPYLNLGYNTNTSNLINGITILWNGAGTGASTVTNTSGVYDFELDGNDDQWSTNNNGIISWYMISAHPYSNLGYYTDTQQLAQNVTVLYDGKGTGATKVANVSGIYDIEGDGNDDEWITNNNGIISWYMISAHQYRQFNGYYTDTATIENGITVLYNGQGTGAFRVAGTGGIFDFELDGNDDQWSTDNSGIVSWYMISAHPYSNLGYYTDTQQLEQSTTVLYDSQGTGAKLVSAAGGTNDVDSDGNDDVWTTDNNGIISWYMVTAHPYFNLGYYTDEFNLENSITVLYNTQGTGSVPVAGASGLYDIDQDGNDDQWTTDVEGVVSWSMYIAHPYILLGYYSDDPTPVYASTVLYLGEGTGAATAGNLPGGIYDFDQDGNDHQWYTNEYGVLLWYMISAHGYRQFNGYYTDTELLLNGISVTYEGVGTGAAVAANLSGTYDVDFDGDLEEWFTDEYGVITWNTIIVHPYSNFGYYSNTPELTSGASILYTSEGTGASIATNLSGIADTNQDGNNEQWVTDNNGVVSWYTISAHPYFNLGYYTDTVQLTNGATRLYSGFGTGATEVTNISGIYDIDLDGNLDQWTTNESGFVSWYTLSAHPYSNLGYYTDNAELTSGVSILYANTGSSSTAASNVTGTYDFNLDGSLEYWSTDVNGVVSWNVTQFEKTIVYSSLSSSTWNTTTNWYTTGGQQYYSYPNPFPTSTTVVIMSGTGKVFIDLDTWTAPEIIYVLANTGHTGFTLASQQNAAFSLSLLSAAPGASLVIDLSGNARLVNNKFEKTIVYRSNTSSTWNTTTNWYTTGGQPYVYFPTPIPTSNNTVLISGTGNVLIDLDDWIAPELICVIANTGHTGITLTSQQSATLSLALLSAGPGASLVIDLSGNAALIN